MARMAVRVRRAVAALGFTALLVAPKWTAFAVLPARSGGQRARTLGDDRLVYKAVDGFAVVERPDGSLLYADKLDEDGWLQAVEGAFVGLIPNPDETLGVARGLQPRQSQFRENRTDDLITQDRARLMAQAGSQRRQLAKSVVHNLVLLLRFKDHAGRPVRLASEYSALFNSDVPVRGVAGSGSVKSYFLAQTSGRIELQSTVVGWIDVGVTEREASAGCSAVCGKAWNGKLHAAIREGLHKAEEDWGVDLRQFDLDGDGVVDALTIVHSGYGAEMIEPDAYGTPSSYRVWSHQWQIGGGFYSSLSGMRARRFSVNAGFWGVSGRTLGRLGMLCHELGHALFGLPDLYDMSGSDSASINVYGIMGNSWGVDGSQLFPGSMSPWSKYTLGWIEPTELVVPGDYKLEPVQAGRRGGCLLLRQGFAANEFLLVEYRSPKFVYDMLLPGGVMVWHIDLHKAMNGLWNSEEAYPGDGGRWPAMHYFARIIQADGRWDLEQHETYKLDPGDYFRDASQVLSDTTSPSLLSYEQHIRKAVTGRCTRTGNKLSRFAPVPGHDAWTLRFERVEQNACDAPERAAGTRMEVSAGAGGLVSMGADTRCWGPSDKTEVESFQAASRSSCVEGCSGDCVAATWFAIVRECVRWRLKAGETMQQRVEVERFRGAECVARSRRQ